MPARIILPVLFWTGLVFILTCGGCGGPQGTDVIEKCLPQELPSVGIVRDGEILHFSGDSLFNYINGAAEMYHKYDFEEVHVGRYAGQGGEITVDIYRFADPDRAFGMYTTLRPAAPDSVGLGVEGFAYGPILVYSKGPYMVNVQTYDDDVFGPRDIEAVAAAVEKNLPGTTKLPDTFDSFPRAGRIPCSERVYADSYLGHVFLTDVYAVDYSFEAGDLTLFITRDEAGEKLAMWEEAAASDGAPAVAPSAPYDSGPPILLAEQYYGSVVAGLRAGWLAGMVGYREGHEQALAAWLEALPGATE